MQVTDQTSSRRDPHEYKKPKTFLAYPAYPHQPHHTYAFLHTLSRWHICQCYRMRASEAKTPSYSAVSTVLTCRHRAPPRIIRYPDRRSPGRIFTHADDGNSRRICSPDGDAVSKRCHPRLGDCMKISRCRREASNVSLVYVFILFVEIY